jgi:hypothetical protein
MGILSRLFGGSPEERYQRFWQWFTANHHRLPNPQAEGMSYEELARSSVLAELGNQLHRVDSGLTFEMGPVTEEGRSLCISAEGIRQHFPAVQAVVAAAPAIPGWKIVAFRQPVGTDLQLQMGDTKLGGDDLWFTARPGGDRLDLTLFVRDLTSQNRDALMHGTFLLLDAALGEYQVGTYVGGIEWEPLPVDPVRAGLTPFRDLPDHVRQFRERTQN